MSFISLKFLAFLLIVLVVLAITQKASLTKASYIKNRNVILLLASIIFYLLGDWRFLILLIGIISVSYAAALIINYSNSSPKINKVILFVAVAIPLLALCLIKYTNFFIETFAGFGFDIKTLRIIFPLGISFYSFRAISYTIDVYRGKIEADRNFCNVALYISFFPQLISGPIVKSRDFMVLVKNEESKVSKDNVIYGLQVFLIGLFKKMVIADHLAVLINSVYANPNSYHSLTIVLAVISYSIQIYMDFSGYSDMAIGCSAMLGFRVKSNFNLPYISRNVTEFWKRWHISLSAWLMEYLYISLGGNRRGYFRMLLGLLITMLLGGLWHGAGWTFIIWGILQGVALCIHKLYITYRKDKIKSVPSKSMLTYGFSILLTFFFISFTWIFFRASDLDNALLIINNIVKLQNGLFVVDPWTIVALGILLLGTIIAWYKDRSNIFSKNGADGFYPIVNLDKFGSLILIFVFIGLIIGFAYANSNPFIYSQF